MSTSTSFPSSFARSAFGSLVVLLATTTAAFARPQSSSAGSCLSFDGVDDAVHVVRSVALEPDEITIEMWAYLDGPQDWNSRLLRKGLDGAYFITADMDFDQRMQILVSQNHPGVRVSAKDTQSHTAYIGSWHHFLGIYATDHAEFWVDGEQRSVVTHDLGALIHLPLTDLYIGAGLPITLQNEYFAGRIDEVRIWNYPRTADEIRATWNRSLTGSEAGLVAYWRFDEGAGQVAHDSSPYHHDGELGASSATEASDPTWMNSEAPITAPNSILGFGRVRFDSTWSRGPFTQLSAHGYHTLGLRADGTIVAWGSNYYGECDVPALPAGTTYTQVIGGKGWFWSAALRSDGDVIAWGNDHHHLQSVRALPPGVVYTKIAAGSTHIVALRSDGAVVAWGDDSYGQLDVPSAPSGLAYVDVNAGAGSTVVLRSDGTLVVCGYDADGLRNVPPLPAGTTYLSVATGYFHMLALRSDGEVVAWGYNVRGQCDVPALPAGLAWVELAAGAEHSLGRRSDGSVVAWGSNTTGQCDVPAIPSGLSVVQLAGGGEDVIWGQFRGHSVALLSDGSAIGWGHNEYLQCNVPELEAGLSYVEVSTGGASETAAGLLYTAPHELVRASDGSLRAFGRTLEGQCNVPTLPAGTTWVEADAGAHFFSLGRRSDGVVVGWGDNSSGQCNVPALPAGLTYVQVAAGNRHALALRSDGEVVAWGDDAYGQCDVPALPSGLTYVEVAASWRHSVARRSDGAVVAWGSNAAGQCDVPALPPGVAYVGIAAGFENTLARRSDGALVAWGDDSMGQSSVPALPSGASWIDVGAGANYASGVDESATAVGLTSDGELVAWGDARWRQTNVPTLPSGRAWGQVSAGGLVTLARIDSNAPCPPPSTYCTSTANSSGNAATIGWLGTTSLARNDFVLTVDGAPRAHSGIFFYGQDALQQPLADGFLCISPFTPGLFRLYPAVRIDPAGHGERPLDFGALHGLGQITAGSTWRFQFWFRDWAAGGTGSNLSNGLRADFCP